MHTVARGLSGTCITTRPVRGVRVADQFIFAALLSLSHLGLLSLYAIIAKELPSPTGSHTQQVRSVLDVLIHGHGQHGSTAYYPAPLGAIISDVQHSIRVDS